MTYCLGLCLNDGLVFASDSRTNAGVDYVTTYSKMHVFTPTPDRVFVILSAGNLATTQEVINHVQRDLDYPPGGPTLASARYLFEAAEYVGTISQQVQQEHSAALSSSGVSGETTLILGGQITGQPHGMLLIYPQGNYITASQETPYLQIGESKYGKPALDRIVSPRLSLDEGARLALVSLDGTSRSNITVGPPFEIAQYKPNTFRVDQRCSFDEQNEFLVDLRGAWNGGIRQAFLNLPRFQWEAGERAELPPSTAQRVQSVNAQSQSNSGQGSTDPHDGPTQPTPQMLG